MRHTPPYSQQFRYVVSSEHAGKSIIDLYNERFSFRPHEYWVGLMDEGKILVNRQGVEPDYIIKENDVIHTIRTDVTEPDVDDNYKVLYEKEGVLVIDKPAPLPVHPAGRYYKNTLLEILRERDCDVGTGHCPVPAVRTVKFHTIHRLDCWTTGVLVLATQKERARFLHIQVERQQMKKVYGVLAKGDFGDKEFEINEAVGRVDGAHRGTGPEITEAKESKTLFIPMAKNQDITLLKAVPITGRTNQIRVHVQAAGGHVLNDPLYSPGGRMGEGGVGRGEPFSPPSPIPHPPSSDTIPWMGLHCREMQFRVGPDDREGTVFRAEWPNHFRELFSEGELF